MFRIIRKIFHVFNIVDIFRSYNQYKRYPCHYRPFGIFLRRLFFSLGWYKLFRKVKYVDKGYK